MKVDAKNSALIKQRARALSYGWGVLHVNGEIAGIKFETALIPPEGAFTTSRLRMLYDFLLGLQLDDLVKVQIQFRETGRLNLELVTCLWFDGRAREAANFYTSIFPDSSLEDNWIAPTDTPGNKQGEEIVVNFKILVDPSLD